MPDFTDLLYGPDELAQQKIRALAAALSGREAAGMLGQLTGDKVLAPFGASLTQRAQHGQDALNEVPQMRLKMAMERLQQEKAQQEAALRNSPAMGGMAQQILGRTGFKPQAGASPAELQAMLPGAEKAASIQKFIAAQPGTTMIDAHTGLPPPGGGQVGGDTLLSGPALDQVAEKFHTTGELPSMGMGPAGALVRRQIINRSAELHPDANLTANKAASKADSGSLATQQKILDNAEGWERTGKANLGVLMGIAKQLHDTGSPWLNGPVRRFAEKATGDPNQTAFKAAHATVVNEYAKILSGAQGSGAVTEGARHEAESMLPLDATWDQLAAAANVLNTDAGNRIDSARQQVALIKGRLGGSAAAPAPAAPHPVPKRKIYDPVAGTLRDGP